MSTSAKGPYNDWTALQPWRIFMYTFPRITPNAAGEFFQTWVHDEKRGWFAKSEWQQLNPTASEDDLAALEEESGISRFLRLVGEEFNVHEEPFYESIGVEFVIDPDGQSEAEIAKTITAIAHEVGFVA
jgi:hypothetical protein